jgi:prepilin-type N-terminal cleavage/methylation domain-containing protein
MKTAAAKKTFPRRGFTLIEIMIVVAIIGLIAAMGVPSMLLAFHKEGMRLAVSDVKELLGDARAQAILKGEKTEVTFHPADRKLEAIGKSVQLPDGIEMAMLDINLLDFAESESAKLRFFPNGTCDELVLVLHGGDAWQKISLEYSTSIASSQPVTR